MEKENKQKMTKCETYLKYKDKFYLIVNTSNLGKNRLRMTSLATV